MAKTEKLKKAGRGAGEVKGRTFDGGYDPANPEFWHKVSKITVGELVQMFVEFIERRKTK